MGPDDEGNELFGQFRMLQAPSSDVAMERIRAYVNSLLKDCIYRDHLQIEIVPYGPDFFPMDYLEKGYDVIALVLNATDPRKGCVGMMLATKENLPKKEIKP